MRAHPRSRGENMVTAYNTRTGVGSSPLTRGKQEGPAWRERPGRLIPAHAGKTKSKEKVKTNTWAHPRSRGENK